MKKAGTFLLAICMSMMLVLTGCGEPDGTSPDTPPAENGGGGIDGGGLDGGMDGGMNNDPVMPE
ncbi:hypothetical protein [Paenibacillus senegalensis]|uniref:hypothetical protein n=1 Tax=Paenibacillus senegalensis TaxID=1465766 RepID=UPI0002894E35|nr:hypothetical protein [Paenibacillus senegalensis]